MMKIRTRFKELTTGRWKKHISYMFDLWLLSRKSDETPTGYSFGIDSKGCMLCNDYYHHLSKEELGKLLRDLRKFVKACEKVVGK
jgi:hypothetical protein